MDSLEGVSWFSCDIKKEKVSCRDCREQEEIYELCRRRALDTISQKDYNVWEILKKLLQVSLFLCAGRCTVYVIWVELTVITYLCL